MSQVLPTPIRVCTLDAASELLKRTTQMSDAIEQQVQAIVRDVTVRGDAAVAEYTLRFEGRAPRMATHAATSGAPESLVAPAAPVSVSSAAYGTVGTVPAATFEIPRAAWGVAAAEVAPAVARAMTLAAERIAAFHRLQTAPHTPTELTHAHAGVTLRLRTLPLDRVGIYAPGGTARYPSSVLMAAVPAKLAGVHEVILVTPSAAPETLLAAQLAGVDRVFEIGGAQAIAALAYGTATIPRVDKIVGPGNAYVAAAKRQVFGQVDIDSVAGPTEVLILADDEADPEWIAADLLAQAEHDTLAQAIAVVRSANHAEAICAALTAQLSTLPRRAIAEASLRDRGAIVLAASIDDAIDFANAYAPEHLSLHLPLEQARACAERIRHAGAVFVGPYASESAGDYLAGSNHVLPTGGSARFSSPLGVYDFQKRVTHIEYTAEAAARDAEHIAAFADSEGLHAHGRAALLRKA